VPSIGTTTGSLPSPSSPSSPVGILFSLPRPSRYHPRVPRALETVALTVLAMTAFAFNSILTRMALGRGHLDAAGFTAVRLASGALMLATLVRLHAGSWRALRGRGLRGPLALFAYMAPFSFAYLRIGAAAGALLLFGTVQVTMIGWGVAHGERPRPRTWLGLVLAAGGLAALILPAASRPDPLGSALMVVAGIAWGSYSLQGRGVPDPLAANARAFAWGVPLAVVLVLLTLRSSHAEPRGLLLATLSGAVTSAVGYAIWYRALRGLTATHAAIVQLSVPVITALAAVALLGESVTARLVACGAAVLGGVALALTARRERVTPRAPAPAGTAR
jgi:drug/metabolite transporter (DMT)-like permease